MSKVVFIIGGSRTGSELLKGILEKYTDIGFVNEMHLLAPRWLRKDFLVQAQAACGSLGSTMTAQKIFDLIDAGRLSGYYWTEFNTRVDKHCFAEYFDASNKQLGDVLAAAMHEKSTSSKKNIWGAKFPVHYAYTDSLLSWFPEALLIHTVRDPRAVYYSQSRKYLKDNDPWLVVVKQKTLQFVHIALQSLLTSVLHLKYKSRDNYYCVYYEGLLDDAEKFFTGLCAFLNIEYRTEMSRPAVYSNSSFATSRGEQKQLDRGGATRWQQMPPLERWAITLACLPALLVFGYRVTL